MVLGTGLTQLPQYSIKKFPGGKRQTGKAERPNLEAKMV